jgi:8-hydroxy-5-deazaflavin:NADPH oxidoreductase
MSTDLPTSAGVLGSGDVGRVLAAGLASRGVAVTLGTGRPDDDDLRTWASGAGVTLGGFAEAAAAGDVVVLAVRGASDALGGVLDAAGGPDAFAGKVLVDVTNPLVFGDGPPPALEVGHQDSGGERLQRRLPGARVVKAFNTVGNSLMVDPELPGGPPTMFIAGDDDAAKATVAAILEAFGWRALDVGGIERSRELESLCILWVAVGVKTGTWAHAITLVTPDA